VKWTEEQQQAIVLRGCHLCVDAGAGSGKTSVLVERIIQLLESRQATLDEIVAITFTEKAAGEMKDRLRRECGRRASMESAQRFSFWRRIERHSDSARISTIHSFCTSLVKEHALTLGFDPDFAVLTEPEERLLRSQVVQNAVEDLLDASDPAAMGAATELGTTGLMRVVQSLLSHRGTLADWMAGASSWDAATIRASWQLRLAEHEARKLERVRRLPALREAIEALRNLAGACDDPTDKREMLRCDLLRCLTVLLDSDDVLAQQAAVAELCSLEAGRPRKAAWTSEDASAAVKDHRDTVKALVSVVAPKELDEAAEALAAVVAADVLSVYTRVAEALESAKRQRLVRDFDDLILDAERVLREQKDLRRQTAQGIKYLLIDEFQDTDHRQLAMALMLAESVQGPEVFFVGDAKQSIYYFRGAEVEVFAEAQRWAGKTIRLAQNFRSVPQVLAFVDEFFRKTNLLAAVEAAYQPMQAVRDQAAETAIEFLVSPIAEAQGVEVYRRLEAQMIAGRLRELCGESGEGGYCYGDAAILMRTMSDVHLYEQALREAGIPYVVASGRGFFERQEVMDIRNLLAAVVEPYDEIAMLGFLRGPIAGLSDEDLLRLCKAGPLPRVMLDTPIPDGLAATERFVEARALLAHLRARMELDAGAFLRHVLECTGYEAILLGQYLGLQRMANVRKLADLAEELSGRNAMGVAEFVRYLDEVASESPAEGDAGAALYSDAVTIMTVHGSKGLEFPVVFLADAARPRGGSRGLRVSFHPELGFAVRVTDEEGSSYSPQICAAIQERHTEKEVEEHARVLYVAMTRARDRLLISGGPEGTNGSWMRSFDEAFGVLSKGDGDSVAGDGWMAVVRRDVPELSRVKCTSEDQTLWPTPEALKARVKPVAVTQSQRTSFPVTAVAHAMANACGRAEHVANRAAFAQIPVSGKERGSLVHDFLEQWDFVAPARGVAERVCLEYLAPEAMVEELCRVAAACAAHPFGEKITADLQPQRERSFSLVIGDAIVEGKIDLVLSDGTLVDYKTGRENPQAHETYQAQILLYALAMRTLDGAAPAAAYLFYVDAGKVVPVQLSSDLLDATLKRAADAIAALRRTEERAVRDEPYMVGVTRC
jgi:ATP-dependent helicase/nuclease subunit A